MTPAWRGAIVGFGAVAEHGHLPGWLRDPRFAIVAVVEPDAARRDQARSSLSGVAVYASLDSLLERERLDFVDIASPPACHAAAIAAAARRGLHVLCEKPLVDSLAAFDGLRDTVAAARIVLHPVHNWLHSAGFHAIRAAADQIGPLRAVRLGVERDGWSVSAGDWRADLRVGGGGILIDHGWHALYVALELVRSPPRSVRALIEKRRYPEADVEDTAHCEIEFEACRATIELTWAASRRRTEWSIVGEAGQGVLCDDELTIVRGGARSVRTLPESLSAGSHHPEWFPAVLDSFAAELADPAQRGRSLGQAVSCLQLLDAAYRSAAAGGVVVPVGAIR